MKLERVTDRSPQAGFFSSGIVAGVFDDPLMPAGKRVVGTPLPEESEVVPTAAAA